MRTSWQRPLGREGAIQHRSGQLRTGKASLLSCAILLCAKAGLSGQAGLELGPSLDFQHLSGSPEKRYILETMGSGVALFDYDGDGDLDIYLVNASTLDRLAEGTPGEPNRLFRNEGGSQYVDVTEAAGVGDRGFGQGVAAADFDNDGDVDLYVTNYGPNALYRNNGDGTFSLMSGGGEDERGGPGAGVGDVGGSGLLGLHL